MNKILFLLLFSSLAAGLFSQKRLNFDPSKGCNYDGSSPESSAIYGFDSRREAEEVVRQIVEQLYLKQNFTIMAADVNNAEARFDTSSGKRYTLYSRQLMNEVENKTGDYWPKIAVLAHEIDHHLNNHSLGRGGNQPEEELEANKFSGAICYRLGASLEQAQLAVKAMAAEFETPTHPNQRTRLEAIAVGYNQAKERSVNTHPGKDVALLFAVQDYNGTSYDNLGNTFRGAEAIAGELREMYGFQTEVHKDKTKKEIEEILGGWQSRSFPEDGQLFVFFSGHGTFRELNKKGYFIPKGSRDGDYSSYLDLTDVGNMVISIPCPHILLAIDACRSGTIDQVIAFQGDPNMKRPGDTPESQRRNTIANQLRNPSRLLLTSGKNERTPTGVEYSPFTAGILTSLSNSYTNGDGLLTYHDLLAGLERVNPIPHYGELYGHKGGGFVFVAKNIPLKPKEKTDIPKKQELDTSMQQGFKEPEIPSTKPAAMKNPVILDGKAYPIVQINGVTWMAQNLDYEAVASKCYHNDPANCDSYGRLYTWKAAQEACGKLGWRLPTDQEWRALTLEFGASFADGAHETGKEEAFKALMPGGRSGFKAQLGGRLASGGQFESLGGVGNYWSATEHNAEEGWGYTFSRFHSKLERGHLSKQSALSCRCVKD